MPFYDTSTGLVGLEQGDILHPAPFIGFDLASAQILLNDQPTKVDLGSTDCQIEEGKLVANFIRSYGMVINQSCDLPRIAPDGKAERAGKDPIMLARISPCKGKVKGFNEEKLAETINMLANSGRSPTVFYLPKYSNSAFELPHSVVSLLEVESFPPSSFSQLCALRKLRLLPEALRALQERFAYCFGRYAVADDLYD